MLTLENYQSWNQTQVTIRTQYTNQMVGRLQILVNNPQTTIIHKLRFTHKGRVGRESKES